MCILIGNMELYSNVPEGEVRYVHIESSCLCKGVTLNRHKSARVSSLITHYVHCPGVDIHYTFKAAPLG